MSPTRELALASSFAAVDDPRIERTKAHNLLDIIIITICAVICGADDWVSVAEFGTSKHAWLQTFLQLPNGIPSHDTFGRVFARINPDQFQQSFLQWIQAMQQRRTDVIAIDGKTHRGSHDRPNGKSALHLVRAWAAENRLVLGHIAVEQHSYLLDQVRSPREVHALVRGHWGIENHVHWVLDVIVHEDASRIRTGDAPQHMGVVRHIALNLLRQEPGKGSVKTKHFRAALSDTYLEQVLGL